jgi:hypothetical protein
VFCKVYPKIHLRNVDGILISRTLAGNLPAWAEDDARKRAKETQRGRTLTLDISIRQLLKNRDSKVMAAFDEIDFRLKAC